MNEKGLVANLLYLAENPTTASPSPADPSFPSASGRNSSSTTSAPSPRRSRRCDASRSRPWRRPAERRAAALHLAISDPSGDSAIFEYVGGKLAIHHGKQYPVMTNSPVYDQQLALDEYWKASAARLLPGTNRAADRFAPRLVPARCHPQDARQGLHQGRAGPVLRHQAVAGVMSVIRAVSVPLGLTTPGKPNISSTIWRTVSDQKNLVYFFDSATRPNTFWVSLAKLDLKPGATVKKLTIQNGEVFSGEVANPFKHAEPFKFLPATPN